METLIRLMEMNINALGSNSREDEVWDSMLTIRAVVAESKKRKSVGFVLIHSIAWKSPAVFDVFSPVLKTFKTDVSDCKLKSEMVKLRFWLI